MKATSLTKDVKTKAVNALTGRSSSGGTIVRLLSWFVACSLSLNAGAQLAPGWQWAQKLGVIGTAERILDVAIDRADGSSYAVGVGAGTGMFAGAAGTVLGGDDGFVAKYNASGVLQWGWTFVENSQSGCTSISLDPAGNVYVTGYFTGNLDVSGFVTPGQPVLVSGGQEDAFVVSYTSTGAYRWAKRIGGLGRDAGSSIDADGAGVSVLVSANGLVSAAGSTANAALLLAGQNIMLARYTLAGGDLWMNSGGSSGADIPLEVAHDEVGIYVSFNSAATIFTWYGGLLGLGVAHNGGDDNNVHVSSFGFDGAHNWTTHIYDADNSFIAPGGLTAGCGGVYLTGSVHSPSIFPGGNVVSTGTYDFFYLTKLDPGTGNSAWTKAGTSGGASHTIAGRSVALGRFGEIHVVGYYDQNITMGSASLTGVEDIDSYMATFRPNGSLICLNSIEGEKNTEVNAIVADDLVGFVIGGAVERNYVTFRGAPSLTLTTPDDQRDGFIVRGQMAPPSYVLRDPSTWKGPDSLCSTSGPVNLNTFLLPHYEGTGQGLVLSQNVTNPGGAVGQVLGSYAQFSTDNGFVTIQLEATVPAGERLDFLWRAAFGTSTALIEVSTDNVSWSSQGNITTTNTAAHYDSKVLTSPALYVRMTRAVGSSTFQMDGAYFDFGSDTGGSWSWAGGSGNMFDPAAYSGTMAITYTVNVGQCAASTTRNLFISTPASAGTMTVPGMVCPGSNSGSVMLSGYAGTIINWESSTNNFVTRTSIANTTATQSFSNIAVSTSYRAYLSGGACGNIHSAIGTVTVGDATPPTITSCPTNIVVNVDPGTCGATVTYPLPTAADNCAVVTMTRTEGLASGTVFPIGVKNITHVIADASGQTDTCTFTITVVDNIPPQITCPTNITANVAAGSCTAVVNYTAPIGTDNCTGAVTAPTAGLASGSNFPLGVTTVTYTVTDAAGLTASCSFTVTVTDNIAPQITCPADITGNVAGGSCGRMVTYVLPIVADNCTVASIVRTAGPASGSIFPVGVTTVTHEVTDGAGLTTNCSFTVTIIDNIAPQITCSGNIAGFVAPGSCGRVVSYAIPIGTDNCAGATTARTAGLASGSTFPMGVNTVTYTVTDAAGLTASCSFTITVTDNAVPQIACPANISVTADAGSCGAVVNYVAPVGTDNCAGATTTRTAGLASGSAFPIGANTVTYAVTDAAGLTASCSFTITVIDNIAPQITCPANITANADAGSCGAVVNYIAPLGTDNCAGATTTRTTGLASGSIFPIGASTVTYTVTDATGLTASCSFTITVADNIAPQITCPANITMNVTAGTCGTAVTYVAPVGTDNCAGATTTRTSGLASGSTFPIGVNTVTYTVTDAVGLTASCSFTITVTDNIAPQIICPANITTNVSAGTCGAVVNYVPPVGTDNCAGALTTRTAGPASGSTFPSGVTTVTHTVTDAAGLTTSCSFTVTVTDNIPPSLICPANIDRNADPNTCTHAVSWPSPVPSDNCPSTTIPQIAGLPNGSQFPIGVSTITYQATDAAGNISTCSFTVTVHDVTPVSFVCPLTDPVLLPATAVCQAIMPNLVDSVIFSDCSTYTVVQSPAPGTLVSGSFTATMTITDAAGNISVNTDDVVVTDVIAPSISCPLNVQVAAAPGTCSATVNYAATGTDNCGASTITYSQDPGTSFPVGVTTVTVTASDGTNTSPPCSFTVTVTDEEPPQISCPANISMNTDAGSCGAVVNYAAPVGMDNCAGATTTLTAGLASGSTFPVGVSMVTYQVTDAAGLTTSCSFTISVIDNTSCGCGNPQPGASCDDGNSNTVGDVIQADCSCAGQPLDCNGTANGTAVLDNCGNCVGGTTGNTPCTQDCAGVWGGTATTDNCGNCVGGTTGNIPCTADCAGVFGGTAVLDNCGNCVGGTTGSTPCVQDCAGVWGGTATTDNCGICVAGTTGNIACTQDCAGVWGGTAILDNCGTCVGGTTGNTPCAADCAGVLGGTAVLDNCGNCVGGTTGSTPCVQDCAGVWGGTATTDNCGICVAGTTGNIACTQDCAGVWGGTAILDNCGTCVGGTTGNTPCTADCAGVFGGTAILDNCGNCVGGTTGNTPCTQDCAGVWGGTANTDNCGNCVGGTTGNIACTQDCAGVWGGTAVLDNCGTCVGGTTGNTPCTQDCAGVWGGTAVLDNCGNCVGGTTGNTPCTQDCAGVWGGTAITDNCGTCVGGTTGNIPCTQDCAGVWGGTAVLDNCGNCVGGTTGNTPCAADCAGIIGGTAVLDNCGNCVGGTTGNTPCVQDCAGVWGGTATADNCGNCVGGTTGNIPCTQDCAGVWGGTAITDNCGICVGGTTGNIPCTQDCAGVWGGTAVLDNCGNCVGGTTGNTPCISDCAGVVGGTAILDNCGTCVGGTTGNIPCTQDCAGVWGGTAVPDNCGNCVGGTTGNIACTQDCVGVWGGTAVLDNCGTCVGGTTGNTPCTQDCAGVWGGTAILDNCGTCVGGTTGNIACTQDCAGVWGGTAVLDNCGICVGGTTGNTPCTADCAGVLGGTAILDNCGNCVGGTTGNIPCTQDCAGVWGGTANTDNCGNCVGGTTGNIPCTQDCAGVWGGTAVLDNCGNCVGGTTGNVACTQDCAGVWGGTAVLDNCGVCAGGTTGVTPNSSCVDCLGVPNGPALPGTPCDDGNACTTNDTWQASCSCAGTPIAAPSAGADNSASICAGTSIDLNTLLVNADAGGVWSDGAVVSTAGTFTYTVTNACGSDVASFTVSVTNLANPAWNGPGTLCASVGPLGLDAFVTGDAGGSWSGNGVSGSVFNAQGVAGSYSITYTVGTGTCQSQETHAITIVPDPGADAGADVAICGLSYTMQANTTSSGAGTWTVPAGFGTASSLSDPNSIMTAYAYGSYSLVWTMTNGICSASDTVVIVFQDPGIGIWVEAGEDQFLEVVSTTVLNGQASPGSLLQWSLLSGTGSITNPNGPTTEVTGLAIGDNIFILSASIGQCGSELDTLLVRVEDLFIPQGYSPNDDTVNDTWEITGMAAFPGSELRIFNRWGQEVYQSDNYGNQWDGRAHNGKPLPDDTYFYVLNLSGERTYNGHVIIKR